MEAWAIFLIVAAGILALTMIITCCSACCLLPCFGSCCSSNPLCCLAVSLLACVGLGPRDGRDQRQPYVYYSGVGGGQYGTVVVTEGTTAVVIPPPPRVVYGLAVPASAPPAELLGSDERIPLATATPVPSSYSGSGKGATDHLRLHTPMTAGDGGGGGGSYYQKEDMPEYPPARIRNISSYTANYHASAPPAPGGEEDEEEAAMAAAAAAVGDGRQRVLLDVPLPPKGAEPRDLWAAVAFVVMACLLATVAVRLGLPALGVWEAELGGSSSSSYRYSEGTVAAARAVLGVAVGLALAGGVLAMAGLHLMLHWSGALIVSTLWGTILGAAVLAFLSLALGHVLGCVLFSLLALAALRLLRKERAKVFLSSANLGLACRALLEHKGVLGVAYLALLVEVLWCALWTLAALGAYAHAASGSSKHHHGESAAVVVLLAVSLYWGQQVCQSLLRCTVVGTVASWWYTPDSPTSPVLPALARAAGPSLGSVCVGSLLVSAVEGLRALIRTMVQSRRLTCLGGCLLDCLAAWVEGLFHLANRFAFVFVGIWGYPYATAAALGIRLFEAKGWQAVLNDLLIGETLLLGSLLVGGLTASLGVYLAHMDPQAFAGLPHPALFLGLTGFFLGLGNCLALLQALGAAVDTIFVAWASDPDSLRRHRPAEYMHLLSAWRHYDEVNGRRLVSAVVGGGGVEVMGLGGGSPSMVYSQSGRHVVQVSI